MQEGTQPADLATRPADHEAADRAAELQAVLDLAPVAVWIAHDPQCRKITGNRYADELVMRVSRGGNISASATPGEASIAYRVFRGGMALPPEELPAQMAAATGRPVTEELLDLVFSDGRVVHMLMGAMPLFDGQGRVRGSVAAGIDVSPLRQAEQVLHERSDNLRRLNRTLQALSRSDRAFMHAQTVQEYLDEACRIIVQDCGYVMVWVGFAEDDAGRTVRPVASAGFEAGYLETLQITWADTERGRGPTGAAIRTGKPCTCANMLTDPAFAPWREQAVARGYASSLVLPLPTDAAAGAAAGSAAGGGRALGAITIYAREPEAFTEDEVELLRTLANDLAHGITILRLRAANQQAEREREITVDFLRRMNLAKSTAELVHAATAFFHASSGCEAVGIRLKDGDDYPYFEARGFPEEFVRAENSLCVRNADGQVLRDGAGCPIQACMCGRVIQGRCNPSQPFFTPHGSFWTNSTTELPASSTEADRQAHTRNRCNGEGYESVALLPLRVGSQCLGLVQINDRRKGRFAPATVALWERLADYLATALAKTRAEDALVRNARRDKLLSDTAAQLLAAGNPQALVEALCREVMAFLDCDAFFNFLADAQTGRLRLNACAGIPQDEARKIEWLDYGVAVCGCAARDGTRIVAADIDITPDPRTDLVRTYGIRAYCCHPLLMGGKAIGTLSFGTRGRARFSEDDIAVMKGVADLVTMAMVRAKDEEALRQNEERFRAAFDDSAVPMSLTRPDGGLLRVNAAFCRMMGYSEEELRARKFYDFTHPDDLAANRAGVQEMLRGTTSSLRMQKRYFRKDGAVVWGDMCSACVRDAQGQPLYLVTHVQDITERKQTEDLLRFLGQCGVSAAGEGFFRELARYLAATLHMEFVRIDRLEADGLAAQTLAAFRDGRFEDPASYVLQDSPCGAVVGQPIRCFPRGVRALFPRDAVLQELQAESYLGATLWSSQGKPIGLMAAIGRQPLADIRPAEAILQLVAVRAAGELERLQAEKEATRHAEELAASNRELTRFNRAMVDRELRMIELKQEVNALCEQAGQKARYRIDL